MQAPAPLRAVQNNNGPYHPLPFPVVKSGVDDARKAAAKVRASGEADVAVSEAHG